MKIRLETAVCKICTAVEAISDWIVVLQLICPQKPMLAAVFMRSLP